MEKNLFLTFKVQNFFFACTFDWRLETGFY